MGPDMRLPILCMDGFSMKVHHMGYLVKDIKKSIDKFRILGYKDIEINRNDARGVDICFMSNEMYTLELVSPFREDSDVSELLKKHQNMIYHICYISENLQEDIEVLKKEGFFPISNITTAPSINESNVIFLYHKSTGLIELVELKKGVNRMKEKLIEVLKESCPDVDFLSSDRLVSDGILDSITTIEIISTISMEFGITIPYEEYTEDNFNSIDAMVALMEKYR